MRVISVNNQLGFPKTSRTHRGHASLGSIAKNRGNSLIRSQDSNENHLLLKMAILFDTLYKNKIIILVVDVAV